MRIEPNLHQKQQRVFQRNSQDPLTEGHPVCQLAPCESVHVLPQTQEQAHLLQGSPHQL